MDYKFLLHRFVQILFAPAKAWKSILSGDKPVKEIMKNYLLPILLILFLTTLAGSLFIANKQLTFMYSLLTAVNIVILVLALTWLAALLLRETTYALDLGRDFSTSWRLVTYSLTPLYVCLIVTGLFESLIFIDILALYSMFIFWDGMVIILNPPDHKKKYLLISTFVIIAGLFAAISIFLDLFLSRFYNAFFA